jgi:hypothetical protein
VPWWVQDSSPLAAFKTEIERRVMEQVCLHSYPSCCLPQGQLVNFMGISNSWFHFIVAAWKHKFLGEIQKTVWSFGINSCDCHVWLTTATTSLVAAATLLLVVVSVVSFVGFLPFSLILFWRVAYSWFPHKKSAACWKANDGASINTTDQHWCWDGERSIHSTCNKW